MRGLALEKWLQQLADGRWWLSLAVIGSFALLYLLTWVDNVGDTDDVYYFAYLVENFPLNYVQDPRLMLYKATVQWLYQQFHWLGIPISGLQLLRGFSALCGAAAVLVFYRLLARDLGLHVYTAATVSLLLAFSYGYWRYAIEAEVYIPAILLLLVMLRWFLLLDARQPHVLWYLLAGLAGGLVVLFYQPNAVPLALALPWLLLRRGRCCGLVLYALGGIVATLAGYYLGYKVFQTHPAGLESFQAFMAQRTQEFTPWSWGLDGAWQATLGSIAVFSHDLMSANWIYAHDWMGGEVQGLFAYEWLVEKRFAAQQAGWLVYPALLLQPAFIVTFAWLMIRAFPFGWRALGDYRVQALTLWLLFHGLVVWRLTPTGPEAWIMLLPPFLALLAVGLLQPAVEHGVRRLLPVLVVLMVLHNAIGGIGIIRDRLSEYTVAQTQWILDHAQPDDVVLIVDDNPLFMTMNYRSDAIIVPLVVEAVPIIAEGLLTGNWKVKLASELTRDLRVVMLDDLFNQTLSHGHRIIFTGNFFEGSRRRSFDVLSDQDRAWLRRLRDALEVEWEDPQLGKVYVLQVRGSGNKD